LLLEEARLVVCVPPLVQLALMSFAITPFSALTVNEVPLQVYRSSTGVAANGSLAEKTSLTVAVSVLPLLCVAEKYRHRSQECDAAVQSACSYKIVRVIIATIF
jgi:hypothetical protein